MPQNDFKVFDELKSNLLSAGDYSSSSTRINGFQSGDTIPSNMFNNVLYQTSAIVYAITSYISTKNNVDFLLSDTLAQVQSKVNYFFNNFDANNLDFSNFTAESLIYIDYHKEINEIESTIEKGLLISEEGNMEFREINKFASTEIPIESEKFFTCDTGITLNINDYELELSIIKIDSGNKAITTFNFDISDLPALSYNVGEFGAITIYDSGFKVKCFYNLYDGTRRWFYLGMTNNIHSASPSKGQYLVLINDQTDQGFITCRCKVKIKEKI